MWTNKLLLGKSFSSEKKKEKRKNKKRGPPSPPYHGTKKHVIFFDDRSLRCHNFLILFVLSFVSFNHSLKYPSQNHVQTQVPPRATLSQLYHFNLIPHWDYIIYIHDHRVYIMFVLVNIIQYSIVRHLSNIPDLNLKLSSLLASFLFSLSNFQATL